MATSFIYWHPYIYQLATRVLYAGNHAARFRAVADLIPHGATVLDCCCGPAQLYHRYLKPKGVTYTGLDVNPQFVARLTRRGERGEVRDLRDEQPLPRAEYVVMQASLYHFLPDADAVVRRMLEAASEHVIIAEPIRNLASSDVPFVRWFGRLLTDPGTGEQPHRFTERSLDHLLSRADVRVVRSFLASGGREKVYLLAPSLRS
jgi:SAM-dependent methyltransferase